MDLRLEKVVQGILPVSSEWRRKARERLDNLAIPKGSLGRLLDVAEQLGGIGQTLRPQVERKAIITMAGDHGVVCEGVSTCPQEVTPQMVRNFVAGGAAINILAEVNKARVVVVDMGVAVDLDDLVRERRIISRKIGYGTRNIMRGPAMTRLQAIRALEVGIGVATDLVEDGVQILGTGDMGIGNTTPSSAILAVFSGRPVREVTGRGTGISEEMLEHKVRVIRKALDVNTPDPEDPIDVLSKVGGFELGGIAGVILAAAYHRIPVVVDGFISSAGALLAGHIAPKSVDYMIAAHRSMERPHMFMLEEMGLKPLLGLDMRLGEGTGSALAMSIIEASARILSGMLTFEEAGVARNKSQVYAI